MSAALACDVQRKSKAHVLGRSSAVCMSCTTAPEPTLWSCWANFENTRCGFVSLPCCLAASHSHCVAVCPSVPRCASPPLPLPCPHTVDNMLELQLGILRRCHQDGYASPIL